MCKFSIGDKVILNSDNESNTLMTINGYLKDEARYNQAFILGMLTEAELKTTKCVWRDDNNSPCEEYYHEDALTIVE